MIRLLAEGVKKTEIAKRMHVQPWTIRHWLRSDPTLMEAVTEAEADLYERAIEQYQDIAFADVEVTAAVKLRALERIIDRREEKERQRSGQMTMAGAERILLQIAAVLEEPRFDEARMAVIEAYEAAKLEVEPVHLQVR